MTLRAWLHKGNRHKFIRRWLPQGLRDWFNYLRGYAIHYRGDLTHWTAARAAAGGYDNAALLERLTAAARAVKAGEAAWEQDGITHDCIPYNSPLLAALCRIALSQGGRLAVLDFGGGLGSIYFQSRNFLVEVRELNWGVVEQPTLVTFGEREIACDALAFYPSIADAVTTLNPNVALLSSVLQYLEQPWEALDEIIATGIPYLIIDRHPCTLTHEMITVQVIPPTLYPASYPSWLFNCPRMLARLNQHFELLAAWDGKDPAIRGWRKGAEFRGYFLKRRDRA